MSETNIAKERTYLAIPFEEKNQAMKVAGKLQDGSNALEYDKENKVWFAHPGADLEKLKRWLPKTTSQSNTASISPVVEFAQVLEGKGFLLPDGMPVMDGQKHRVQTIDDRHGQKSGIYVGYLDGKPAGWYQDHRNSTEPTKWVSSGESVEIGPKSDLIAIAQQRKHSRAIALQKTHQHNSKRCAQLYDLLPDANMENQYLINKGVKPYHGTKQDKKGRLVIPLINTDGHIMSLSRISSSGFKSLKKNAMKQGCYFVVGNKELKDGEPVLYAEGYSTAATIAAATGRPTVMTIDAGNMPVVARNLKDHYPNSLHVFLGDNDIKNIENKGANKAKEAANITKGIYMLPNLTPEELQNGKSDFNDLQISQGIDAVKSQIENALAQQQKSEQEIQNSIEDQNANEAQGYDAEPTISDPSGPGEASSAGSAAGDSSITKAVSVNPATYSSDIPDHILKAYTKQGNKYFFDKSKKHLAWVDNGVKLQTKISNPQIASSLVGVAASRGWKKLRVRGSQSFCRMAWIEATTRGLEVHGYTPQAADLEIVQKHRQHNETDILHKEAINRSADSETDNLDNKGQAVGLQHDSSPNKVKADAIRNDNSPPNELSKKHPDLLNEIATVQLAEKYSQRHLPQPDRSRFVSKVREKVASNIEQGQPSSPIYVVDREIEKEDRRKEHER